MEPLLDVQNLSVSFPTANGETTVLHNASYRHHGKRTAIALKDVGGVAAKAGRDKFCQLRERRGWGGRWKGSSENCE